MKKVIDWIYNNVPFVGRALALRLIGDSGELFYEMSDRPVFNSPWGWHERIRHLEKNVFFVSSAWKATLMAKHNLWLFRTPILCSVNEKVLFADGSKGAWVDDKFVEIL